MKRAKMKRGGIRPFRIMAVFLSVVALVMICKFPERAVVVERRQEQLAAAASAYYDAQSRYNQLNTALSETNTRDFIERTARREHGFCWYGETVYEVGNLDELRDQLRSDVYEEKE